MSSHESDRPDRSERAASADDGWAAVPPPLPESEWSRSGSGSARDADPAPYAAHPPAASGPRHEPAGFRPDDRLNLTGGFSETKRSGEWVLPPYLKVHAMASSVRLDCRQARPHTPVIDLEILPGMGSVTLVLPEGWAVDADRLGKGIGTIRIAAPGIPSAGSPTLVLHGSIGMGTLRVRPENRWDRWRS